MRELTFDEIGHVSGGSERGVVTAAGAVATGVAGAGIANRAIQGASWGARIGAVGGVAGVIAGAVVGAAAGGLLAYMTYRAVEG